MTKKIKLMSLMLLVFIAMSCSSSDDSGGSQLAPEPNVAPTAVGQLTYPTSGLLCIDSTIDFQWTAATDANGDVITYKLTVALDRNFTNIVEQVTSNSTNKSLTLQTGTAYYWNVIAKDQADESSPSATYAFYTEGDGVSNYAPFTAALNTPELESMVTAGTTNLSWTGSDVNTEDTLTYDLYLAESLAGLTLFQADLSSSNYDITTEAAKTYFWRIDTKDDSGVKSIGQVWSFSTN